MMVVSDVVAGRQTSNAASDTASSSISDPSGAKPAATSPNSGGDRGGKPASSSGRLSINVSNVALYAPAPTSPAVRNRDLASCFGCFGLDSARSTPDTLKQSLQRLSLSSCTSPFSGAGAPPSAASSPFSAVSHSAPCSPVQSFLMPSVFSPMSPLPHAALFSADDTVATSVRPMHRGVPRHFPAEQQQHQHVTAMSSPSHSLAPSSAATSCSTSASNAASSSPSNSLNPSDEDRKTTLWMGDLEQWMDEDFVKQIWHNFGEAVDVKIIRDRFTGVNAGYCFVDFASSAAAAKALMSLSGTFIPNSNKLFKLNWASGGGIMDKKEFAGPEFSIFVGDLGPDVHDNLLLVTFQSRFASCRSAKVVTDPMTGLSRGYGFVRFGEEAEQQRAMVEMQGVYCGSRPMRISVATPKGRFGAGYGGGVNGGSGSGAGSPWSAGIGAPPHHQQPPHQPPHHLQHHHHHSHNGSQPSSPWQGGHHSGNTASMYNDPNNTTVFVGGLTGTYVGEEELAGHFASFGPIVYVKIPPGKGCGFVSFVHRQSAEHAIAQLNGTMLAGNRIRLSWGRSNASMAGMMPGLTANGPTFANSALRSPSSSPYGMGMPPASPSSASSPEKLLGNLSLYSPSTTPALDAGARAAAQRTPTMMTSSVALLRENLDESYSELEDFIWKKGSSFYSAATEPASADYLAARNSQQQKHQQQQRQHVDEYAKDDMYRHHQHQPHQQPLSLSRQSSPASTRSGEPGMLLPSASSSYS